MNTLDVAHEVTTRGFTVVPDALDPEAVDCLTGVLDRLVARGPRASRSAPPRRRLDVVQRRVARRRDRRRRHAPQHPSAHRGASSGPRASCTPVSARACRRTGPTISRRVHVDSPRVIPGYPTNIGALVALTDFTEENGATRSCRARSSASTRPTQGGVRPRRGDGVSAGRKRRDLQRPDVAHRRDEPHDRAPARPDRELLPLVHAAALRLPADGLARRASATLSPLLRRVLGFDVRMPTSLDEYYVTGVGSSLQSQSGLTQALLDEVGFR